MNDANMSGETEQISVAELLARHGKQSQPPGRRRRRGGKGSITVASLTGELPVVRDEPDRSPPVAESPPPPAAGPATSPPPPLPRRMPTPPPVVPDAPTAPPEPAWSAPSDDHRLLSGHGGGLLHRHHDTDAAGKDPAGKETVAVPAEPINHFEPVQVSTDTEAPGDEETTTRAKGGRLRQWASLLAQVVVGVVVGALLFMGFERLWDMLPWVALALAILVILALVALVRVLRKTDDILSIVIAIVVGVFVTMGPLAFLLTSS